MQPRILIAIAALLYAGLIDLSAADIVWTNLVGGNWNVAANWSPNTVPGATDSAYITNAGTYTVTINAAAAVTNLTIGGTTGTQTVANANFTLTLNGDSSVGTNGIFAMDAGAILTGAGHLNVAGALNWLGGTMSGTGKTTVTNSGTLTISGFSYGKTLARNLDLLGTGTFTGTTFNAGNGAAFTLATGALFDFLSDSGWGYTGGGAVASISVGGTLRKTGGAGQANLNLTLNNTSTGTVQGLSGDFRFIAGGLSSGTFNAQGGAAVSFGGGTHVMTNGISFTASSGGFFRCDGGTLAFETPYTFNPQFNLDIGGTLAGSQNVNFASTLNWLGGTMSGTGRTIITNGATLTISGFSYGKTLHRNVDLLGTGTFTGTTFNAGNGAAFTLATGALFDFLSDTGWGYTGGGAVASISVGGTLRKTGGAGQANLNLVLNNTSTGTVQGLSGDFRFLAGGLSSGTFNAQGGAAVSFGGGTHVMTNGVSFTASSGGFFRCDGGNLAFETPYTFNPQFNLDIGGTLAGSQNVNFVSTLNWLGGTMSGTGRTTITNGATLTISGFSYGKTLARNLDLLGTGTFTGTTFNAGNGAAFTLATGALFDFLSDTGWGYTGGGAVASIVVGGTLRKTGGAGQANLNLVLNNTSTGTVQGLSGDFRFIAGGLSSGTFNAQGGAAVSFGGGTHVMTNGVSFTASSGGFFRCDGGNLAFETPYTFNPQFNLDIGGTLAGSQNVNFVSTLNWLGGTMSGTGRTTITNGATLTISGFSYGKTLARNLDLLGTGTFTGTTFNAGNGAFINVFGGATFDFLSDTGIGWTGGGGLATLLNSGTVRKTAGAGTANINLVVTNNGTFSAQSGTLNFQNTYRQDSGQTTLAGGHYQALLLDINGGSLTGNGNIAGRVRNNGAAAPGNSFGLLSVTGSNNFTNTPAGTYHIQLGGTNRGVNYDSIAVSGTAVLSGSVQLSFTNGFIPPIGSVYTAMTFNARSGIFTNSNAMLLGFVELYTPTNYLLIASNGQPQLAFTLGASLTQAVCQPFLLSAQAFDLDGTITNLAILVNGSPIAETTNNTLETTLEIDFPASYTLEARAYDDKGALASSNQPVLLATAQLETLMLGGVRSNTTFKLCMAGLTGTNYGVLANTNLLTTNWVNLGPMAYTNGIWRFYDASTITNLPRRYYRAVREP